MSRYTLLLSQEGTTQGDPLAMAMYAIAITPLIHRLEDEHIKQVWFADDATAGGDLFYLKMWWDTISGPDFGYYPNATKTWLVVKDGYLRKAMIFMDLVFPSLSKEKGTLEQPLVQTPLLKLMSNARSPDGYMKLSACLL